MKREWFIKINEMEQGPFSVSQLKINPHITPETLVRKKGWSDWVPIGRVPELKEVFEDEEKPEEENVESHKKIDRWQDDQITLTAQRDPGNFIIWLIIILLLITWIFYNIN